MIAVFATIGMIQAQDTTGAQSLSPFPEAKPGMVRYVLYPEIMEDESQFMVELIPGKIMSVDCNHHFLMGTLEEIVLEGWGYTYYEFSTNGMVRSTMMACQEPNEDRFIQAESLLVDYNSKLPIVVYLPEGYDVLYKIWEAGETMAFPIEEE